MTDKIFIITPPDKLFNQNKDILMIHPSTRIKEEMQELIRKSNKGQNIYIYDLDEESHDLEWLLTISKVADIIVLDVDNCSPTVRLLVSYIISLPHTYWLTNEDKSCYTLLNPNRIYHLDIIENLIGGTVEESTQ